MFGSNLIFSEKIARGDALIPWATLRAAPPTRGSERQTGFEPATFSLPTRHRLRERDTRIELASPPWEGGILPVY